MNFNILLSISKLFVLGIAGTVNFRNIEEIILKSRNIFINMIFFKSVKKNTYNNLYTTKVHFRKVILSYYKNLF